MRRRRFERSVAPALVLGVAGSVGACAPEAEPDVATAGPAPGERLVEVEGGRVWTRVVGAGEGTPLLLLHGGPGAGSYYLEPMAALGDERPVVFYDQLGAGRSDHPTDTTLWRIPRFVDELRRVREALGLDEVHLLGHSWGSMLAIEYLLTEPEGVRSAIFASPLFATERWTADADSLVRTLPDSLRAAIETHEAAGTTDSPEYQAAVMDFYHRFLLRRDPWPPQMDSTFARFGVESYGYMWGPSEFTATGTLEEWDRMDALAGLDLPVLFTVGRYDETFVSTVEEYRSRVRDARLVVLENSAHLTMLDEPEAYVAAVRAFLREVESR